MCSTIHPLQAMGSIMQAAMARTWSMPAAEVGMGEDKWGRSVRHAPRPRPKQSWAVTVAFGVRNFEHIDRGYEEMYRVIKPGGMLCVLELSTPQNRFIRFFYDLYAMHIIPFVGSLKSGDKSAYRYLPESIAAVPQGEQMLEIMRSSGFKHCKVHRLTLGVCSIYTGIKL